MAVLRDGGEALSQRASFYFKGFITPFVMSNNQNKNIKIVSELAMFSLAENSSREDFPLLKTYLELDQTYEMRYANSADPSCRENSSGENE